MPFLLPRVCFAAVAQRVCNRDGHYSFTRLGATIPKLERQYLVHSIACPNVTLAPFSCSYTCMPGGTVSTRAAGINANTVTNAFFINALAAGTATSGATTFTIPAAAERRDYWAALTQGNVLQLRNNTFANGGVIECFYARLVPGATANSTRMIFVVLGGTDLQRDWTLQCNPATYAAIPDIETAPFCAAGADGFATRTTQLYQLDFAGGGNTTTSSPSPVAIPTAATGTPSPSKKPANGAESVLFSLAAGVAAFAAAAAVMRRRE